MGLKVLIEKRDGGGFKATVPTLPGCISSGLNEKETLENVRSEILLHLGIEEVSQARNWKDVAYYQCRLAQTVGANMSEEKRLAALTTLLGLALMSSVIWTANFFA